MISDEIRSIAAVLATLNSKVSPDATDTVQLCHLGLLVVAEQAEELEKHLYVLAQNIEERLA